MSITSIMSTSPQPPDWGSVDGPQRVAQTPQTKSYQEVTEPHGPSRGATPRQGAQVSVFEAWGVRARNSMIQVGDVEARFQEVFAEYQTDLRDRLVESGVSLDTPFALLPNASGGVVVAGNHPDRDAIEALFTEDSEFRNRFAQVSSMATFIHSAQENAAFREAYAQDPQAAVERYHHLLSGNRHDVFVLLVDKADMTVRFAG